MSSILSRIYIFFYILVVSTTSFAYVPVSSDSRIKTLIYSSSEVFYLTFHYNYQSYIEFPEDEQISIITLGDRYSWNVKKIGQRVFIKPYQVGVSTNMTIISDKREYHFEIFSSKQKIDKVDPKLAFVVKFFYPENVYDYMNSVKIRKPVNVVDEDKDIQKDEKKPEEESVVFLSEDNNTIIPPIPVITQPETDMLVDVSDPVDLMDITNVTPPQNDLPKNFKYSMVGDQESQVKPYMVYDDGVSTYFTFNSSILPDIFVVMPDGSEVFAEYKIFGNEVVVNDTTSQFSLRNNKEVICIFNDNLTEVYY
jgi:type IV secretory pathway VirB9-like protein